MKSSLTLAVMAATCILGSTLHAEENPEQLTTGQLIDNARAEREQGRADCIANNSQDHTMLRNCQNEVESAYMQSLQNISGGDPVRVQNFGASSDVVTDVADSYYEDKGPDVKGWMNSDLE